MKKAVVFLVLPLLATLACAQNIEPFSTDGCSAFPDGTPASKTLWLSCCVAHDAAYWAGGTLEQRKQADLTLALCVENRQQQTLGQLMFFGVRVGGSPYWPTSFRWGYGWPFMRGYQALSAREIEMIDKKWPSQIARPSYLAARPSAIEAEHR